MPPLNAASGIEEGQLPVAWTAGQEDKVAFLALEPATITGGHLTLTLAVDDSGSNHGVEEAGIMVCALMEPWEAESPMAWDRQPRRECDQASYGIYQPTTEDFFFDLSVLLPLLDATGWHGIVLAPNPNSPGPIFQVVFRSAVGGGAKIDDGRSQSDDLATDDDMAPPPPPSSEQSVNGSDSPVEIDSPAEGTSASSDIPVTVPQTTNPSVEAEDVETERARPPLPQVSPRPSGDPRSSLAGFYAGLGSLAMLLVVRRAAPLLHGLWVTGTGYESEAGTRLRRDVRR